LGHHWVEGEFQSLNLRPIDDLNYQFTPLVHLSLTGPLGGHLTTFGSSMVGQ